MHVGIGMRSIKTGLAVFICLIIYTYTPLNDPVLAVVVAVSSIQNSIDDSVTFSKNRLVGTFLGTFIGIAYNYIAQQSLLLIALGVIVLITLLNRIHQSKSILIATAVFVSIITGVASGNPIVYGLNKFTNTLVGITIGFLINYLIKPPNQIENIKMRATETVEEIERITQQLIFTNDTIDLKKLKEQMQGVECSFNIYNQDKKYNSVTMDKIKHVERSIQNYSKLYSQLELIKNKRVALTKENIEEAETIFVRDYSVQDEVVDDMVYATVYNYHIREILEEIKNIRKARSSISKAQVVGRSWKLWIKPKEKVK